MEQQMQSSGKPVNVIVKKEWYKRWWVIITVAVIVIVVSVSSEDSKEKTGENNKTTTESQPEAVVSQADKETAQKELDELMDLSKKAGLVTSYEFSDKAAVIYVTDLWYTQTVDFKKDFLAGNAMRKEKITGYRHYEIRHYKSNEKVAEVTAFTGSLEVYK